MKFPVLVFGGLAGLALTSCVRADTISYSPGGDFSRPPVTGLEDPALTGHDPAYAPPPTTSPDGWDVANPAPPLAEPPHGGTAAGTDPYAFPPAPPPPAAAWPSVPPPPAPPAYAPPAPHAARPPDSPPLLAPGAMAAGTSDADPLYYSFLGVTPPELAADGLWLTPAPGPNVSSLRGQVVLLQFSFQGCESCALLTPYLTQWHNAFAGQGLVVVYVNNGLMSNEPAAREAIRDQGLPFAYFHDAKGETLRQYGIRQFPTSYLIDRKGRVIWEGTALAQEAKLQELIVEALK